MSVLIIAENPKGRFKKSAFELTHYGHKVAEALGTECIALVIGKVEDAAALGKYGASKVVQIADFNGAFDSSTFGSIIRQVVDKLKSKVVIVNHSANGKTLTGTLGVKLNAGVVSQVNAVPKVEGGKFSVTKPVFSGKAFAEYAINTDIKVMSLMGNAIPPIEVGAPCPVEAISVDIPMAKVVVKETKTVDGTVPLPEAELVVSAGRGMKGPENWGIIEELATTIGATTACSRPVADTGWRPHHEHVGQTGVAIRPNLYIAAGISGAIQHLAGVNSSKCIVVINKDAEAPFFKAADYGVCADLFDVVPRLTEAFKKSMAEH
jgi:electron transfer flavoprotein alpha subunit